MITHIAKMSLLICHMLKQKWFLEWLTGPYIFFMVVFQIFLNSVQIRLLISVQILIEKILTDNHCKIICGQVRIFWPSDKVYTRSNMFMKTHFENKNNHNILFLLQLRYIFVTYVICRFNTISKKCQLSVMNLQGIPCFHEFQICYFLTSYTNRISRCTLI